MTEQLEGKEHRWWWLKTHFENSRYENVYFIKDSLWYCSSFWWRTDESFSSVFLLLQTHFMWCKNYILLLIPSGSILSWLSSIRQTWVCNLTKPNTHPHHVFGSLWMCVVFKREVILLLILVLDSSSSREWKDTFSFDTFYSSSLGSNSTFSSSSSSRQRVSLHRHTSVNVLLLIMIAKKMTGKVLDVVVDPMISCWKGM
jgi:hypothetical protein